MGNHVLRRLLVSIHPSHVRLKSSIVANRAMYQDAARIRLRIYVEIESMTQLSLLVHHLGCRVSHLRGEPNREAARVQGQVGPEERIPDFKKATSKANCQERVSNQHRNEAALHGSIVHDAERSTTTS